MPASLTIYFTKKLTFHFYMRHTLSISTYQHRYYQQHLSTHFLYKQSIFDPRPENCLSFSQKLPQNIA